MVLFIITVVSGATRSYKVGLDLFRNVRKSQETPLRNEVNHKDNNTY